MSDTPITYDLIEEPCPMCGHLRLVRNYASYPVTPPPSRPQEEHDAARRANDCVREQTELNQNERV